ncbi:MAG: PASTA domain-containing protein [Prevotellaceae bacterium]|jgi:beta-lactam-binding protein with PASTA domain|nr:PASTA domain-containing protein [Prevotellaceae bacterium]
MRQQKIKIGKRRTNAGAAQDLLWRIWGNFYARHLIMAASVVVLALLLVSLWLMIYTRHGQTFALPDFANLSLAEAQRLANEKRLRIEVIDSVFIAGRRRGAVVEQNPKPKVRVKDNRTVFLTMNAMSAKKVNAPSVTGLSLRQAKATIELQGLEVGRLLFAPDMASGNVLGQLYGGRPLRANEQLTFGSKIDLLVGKSYGSEHTALPRLKGLSLPLAKSSIIEASLNVGAVKYDESVKTLADSLEARVYAQHPAADAQTSLEVGSSVSIYLTVNTARLEE